MLDIQDLCCGYGNKTVVKDISFTLAAGEIICLLGPNGVGKTTFFKTLLGFLKPLSGQIRFQNEDILSWPRKRFARTISYVPQANSNPFPFSGRDVVVAGRNAHTGFTSTPSKDDYHHADSCLSELGILHLRNKIFSEMSGGERQLILIARALAQTPRVLVMDEPTSNLDYGNQIKIINLIHYLSHHNMAVILTTHSPDQVLLYRCRAVVFRNGNQTHEGTATQIITEQMLREVYSVETDVCTIQTRHDHCARVCIPTINP